MRIRAFQGLVPAPAHAAEVACVPYDVVDAAEAAALAAGRPRSLLHVDRAEIDLPPGTDPYGDAVYARARENFLRLQRDGVLVRESGRCLYLYQQQMGAHVQRGLVAVCHVDDYDAGLIKKHERTRPDKEDDRTRLIDALSANTGPVFLTYRDEPAVGALIEAQVREPPQHDFVAPDGIRHTAWRIPGGAEWVSAFERVPALYIADGHHRAASAARVARLRREAQPTPHRLRGLQLVPLRDFSRRRTARSCLTTALSSTCSGARRPRFSSKGAARRSASRSMRRRPRRAPAGSACIWAAGGTACAVRPSPAPIPSPGSM